MASTLTPIPALPGDIRLMNATASLLAAIGTAALVATALTWLVRQPVFAVKSIRIEGEVMRNSVSTIRANAAPKLAGNFFTMDLSAAQQAFESVPWVRQALVQRVWPNRLRVQLQEHRPVALWGSEGEADKLVSSTGDVFEANLGDVEEDRLPTLRGADGSAPHMLAMLGRLTAVLAPLDPGIDTLEQSGRGSWRVVLGSGAEVELGRGSDDEVLARTERFVATLGDVTSFYQRPLEYADLRHNDAYAVRLRGITTTVDVPGKPTKK